MLKILGDVCFADGYFDTGIGIGSSILKGANPFEHLNRQPEDLWIGNFECVCSAHALDNIPFVIDPAHLDNIHHLDVYGVANNHVMQYGEDGYNDLLKYLNDNNIAFAGSNLKRSVIFNHQGKRVGMMAFSLRPDNFSDQPLYWHLPEMEEIAAELRNMESCNFKIVFMHWGYEFINYPNIEQKKLGRWIIDSGADMVVGMHPHVAQGYEIYNDRYIFYSLGNAVFDMPWQPTKYGLLLTVDLSSSHPEVSTEYLHIGNDYFPSVVTDVPEYYSLEHLNSLLHITDENEKYFADVRKRYLQYRRVNRLNILRKFLRLKHSDRVRIINSFIKRRIK